MRQIQHVVSEILRRLDEKDTQMGKLQQRLADQEKLNSEQNKRLFEAVYIRTMTSSAESIYMHQMAATVRRRHKRLCFNSPKVMTSLYAMCTAMKVAVAITIAHLLGL